MSPSTLPSWRVGAVAATAMAGLVTAGLVTASCSSDEKPHGFMGADKLTVAMHNDLPGVSFLDGYTWSGYDYLFAQEIKNEFGVKVAPVDVATKDRVTSLTSDYVNLVVAAFSITPDRMRKIDFAGPYLTTYQGFLVGKKGADIRSMNDLRNKRVCAWSGTTNIGPLQGLGFEVVEMPSASACLKALVDGGVDAFSTDQLILYGFAHQYAKDKLKVIPDLTVGAPQYYGVGMPKGHRADCLRLREFIKKYVESNDWIEDIQVSLPEIPKTDPGWANRLKPSANSIEARSCRDKASP
ncbi:transporter substrate-binding domain-containing protein [Streptomyces sp. BG9H]|uniref:Transporter substrate-binding domain-containing protein n=1 Tax=Streptomyces anatolicus TaxID=2675858 RepID=A0ABS6YU20_9ACTN|nr:transporter substrate-binding domain-containing protein [Streptomyces anatolicus]MBW5424032.1 transporter substrate-binding domain-containing protein [Streptomyces anatolicus]